MSDILGSPINKTAILASKIRVGSNTDFGAVVSATPQKIAARTKIEKKVENTVTIDGVTIPRQPTQQSMAEYYSSEQATRLLKKIPLTVYVIDNFQNKKCELLGYDEAGNGIGSSHGAVAVNIANSILHGKAKIERMDVSKSDIKGWDSKKIKQSLELIIQKEARLQNKTVNNVDLSHVAVNLSLGGEGMATPEFAQLIKKITDRGGHIFQSAGNHSYQKQASLYKNIIVVDASDRVIGGTISPNATCSVKLNNLCDSPEIRKIDLTSSNIIAPQRLVTRSTPDGKIERRDEHSSTGWMPFIDKSDTDKITIDNLKGFDGVRPTSIPTIKEVQDFLNFKADLYKKNPTYTENTLVENKITAQLHAECERRFGNKAVIPIEYLGLANKMPLFDGSENKLSITIPSGIKPENILVPLERSLFKSKNIGTTENPISAQFHIERGEIPYYTLDKDKKLKLIAPSRTVMTDGTSWATPYALAEAELGYRVRVEKASSKAKP
jgi:hypothetical protein